MKKLMNPWKGTDAAADAAVQAVVAAVAAGNHVFTFSWFFKSGNSIVKLEPWKFSRKKLGLIFFLYSKTLFLESFPTIKFFFSKF